MFEIIDGMYYKLHCTQKKKCNVPHRGEVMCSDIKKGKEKENFWN